MGTPGQLDYSVTEYQRYGVRLDNQDHDPNIQLMRAVPTSDLWGAEDTVSVAELQW
jgi:hypothetical protein